MMQSKLYHTTLFLSCFSLAFSIVSGVYISMPNVFSGHHSSWQLFLTMGAISLFLAAQFHLDICVIYLMFFALVEVDDEDEEDLDDDDDDVTEEETDQLEATTESETQKGN